MKESGSFKNYKFCNASLEESLFLNYFHIKGNKRISITYRITTINNMVFQKIVYTSLTEDLTADEVHRILFLDNSERLLKEIISGDNIFLTDGLAEDRTLSNIWIRSDSVISVSAMIPRLEFYEWKKLSSRLKILVMHSNYRKDVNLEDLINFLPEYVQLRSESSLRLDNMRKQQLDDYTVKTVSNLLLNKEVKVPEGILNRLKEVLVMVDDDNLKSSLRKIIKTSNSIR